jgi:galactonate dehydratase
LPRVGIKQINVWAIQQPHDRRAYVVVKLGTDAGLSGWGECTAGPDLASTARTLRASARHIVGLDATAVEQVKRRLAQTAIAAPIAHGAAQAAVNMALVDILGKLTNVPAFTVLGGPTRHKAFALAPLSGATDAELITSLEQSRQAGFRAAMIPLPYGNGPVRGRRFFEQTRQLLDRLRQIAGDQFDFVLDCAGRPTPAEAIGLARQLEPFHLLWLDEPCGAAAGHKAVASISAESVTPIGLGRHVEDNSPFQDLLRLDALDVLRPDISRCGMTQVRKAAALAETYYVAVAPYHDGGPIATAAALHVAASIPNFFIQQVPFPSHPADLRMRRQLAGDVETVTDGYFPLPKGPGLGIQVSEEALARYSVAI